MGDSFYQSTNSCIHEQGRICKHMNFVTLPHHRTGHLSFIVHAWQHCGLYNSSTQCSRKLHPLLVGSINSIGCLVMIHFYYTERRDHACTLDTLLLLSNRNFIIFTMKVQIKDVKGYSLDDVYSHVIIIVSCRPTRIILSLAIHKVYTEYSTNLTWNLCMIE